MSTQPVPNGSIPDETYADVYFFRLRGLSPNASVPWGAGIAWLADRPDSIVPISINDQNSSFNAENLIEGSAYLNMSSASKIDRVDLLNTLTAPVSGVDETPYIILGKQGYLSSNERDSDSTYISTTPFGLNLGASGVWNGSVVLGATEDGTDTHTGAHYDANRVATGKWTRVSAVEQNNTILDAGVQTLGTFGVQKFKTVSHRTQVNATDPFSRSVADGQRSTFPTIFNYSSEAIIFPSGSDLCGSNITLTLQTDYGQPNETTPITIPLFGNLTSSSDRCHTNPDTSEKSLILGKPLLQAAYLVVTYNASEIWLTNAHQLNLPPCAAVFNSSANLIGATNEQSLCGPNPLTPLADKIPEGPSGATIAGIVLGCLFILAFLGTVILLVIRRRRRQRSAKLAASQQTELRRFGGQVPDDSVSEISEMEMEHDRVSVVGKK